MNNFKGDIQDLKDKVLLTGINGEWKELNNGSQYQYRTDTDAVLNWWPSKGTLQFQGKSPAKEELADALANTANMAVSSNSVRNNNGLSNKIFVVYGHDQNARNQLDAMLRRWGLDPLILDQLPSKGQTIIEKLEEYTADVGFAVVLATPDDEGYRRNHEDEKTYRARQNVVLELGMLLTKLKREKVAILLKDQETMERPSDIQGLIYIPFKDDLQKEAGSLLAKEMAAQGYSIDIKNL